MTAQRSVCDSAAIYMANLGNRFAFIVFDECHHLPGNLYREAALMSAAPYRLGLTATPLRSDGRQAELAKLIGPNCYQLQVQEAAGSWLATYRVVRIPVTLSATEQARYDELAQQVRRYVFVRGRQDVAFNWSQ
ncbi:MAG: DEAD/DEAH box helicase family protein [Pirellulaceae bacterium]|nr:DEAD/DEAH box helicase family protein [Pirellulaceae bacterium]